LHQHGIRAPEILAQVSKLVGPLCAIEEIAAHGEKGADLFISWLSASGALPPVARRLQ